jgi:hexokinase
MTQTRNTGMPVLMRISTGSMADVPKDLLTQIKEFEDIFTVDKQKLKEVVAHFVKELEKGVYYPLAAYDNHHIS